MVIAREAQRIRSCFAGCRLKRWLGIFAIIGGGCIAFMSNADAEQDLEYTLGPGDKLRATVFGHPDLSGQFLVDGSGKISFPLIGDVEAGGRTVRELERLIINKLKPDYLKSPNVSVDVLNYRPFYIIGEVKNPGSYPYVNGMVVINAIALAGGYTYRAREDRLYITRAKDPERKKQPVNQEAVVFPGDVIEVPERFF